jgi:hypothetical protein
LNEKRGQQPLYYTGFGHRAPCACGTPNPPKYLPNFPYLPKSPTSTGPSTCG